MEVVYKFTGLPPLVEEKITFVEDEFRTNILSHIVGGYLILIEFWNINSIAYSNIKKPSQYLQVALKNYYQATQDGNDGKITSDPLTILKLKIARIFISSPKFLEVDQHKNAAVFLCEMAQIWSFESESLPLIDDVQFQEKTMSTQFQDFYNLTDKKTQIHYSPKEDIVTIPSGQYTLNSECFLISHSKAIKFTTVSFKIHGEQCCFAVRNGEEMNPENEIKISKYESNNSRFKDIFIASNA